MSALGQKQTFALQKVMSALPPKATSDAFCFGPKADIISEVADLLSYYPTLNRVGARFIRNTSGSIAGKARAHARFEQLSVARRHRRQRRPKTRCA
jgi:hypothetical protein